MQDAIAIAVAVAAAAWLAWSLVRRCFAPPCRPPQAAPGNADGFVPLDRLIPGKTGENAPSPARGRTPMA
jgi:hypothetical protein